MPVSTIIVNSILIQSLTEKLEQFRHLWNPSKLANLHPALKVEIAEAIFKYFEGAIKITLGQPKRFKF